MPKSRSEFLVYVSGPCRPAGGITREENIEKARLIAVEIWRAGYAAFCPHTNSGDYPELIGSECTELNVMLGTLEILRRCDAIMLLPGWQNSGGSKKELSEAIDRDLAVCLSIPDIEAAYRIWSVKEDVDSDNADN